MKSIITSVVLLGSFFSFVDIQAQSSSTSELMNVLRTINERQNTQQNREYEAGLRQDRLDLEEVRFSLNMARQDYYHSFRSLSNIIETYSEVGLLDSLNLNTYIVDPQQALNLEQLVGMYFRGANGFRNAYENLMPKYSAIRRGMNGHNTLPIHLVTQHYENIHSISNRDTLESYRASFFENEFFSRSEFVDSLKLYHFIGWEHYNLQRENYVRLKTMLISREHSRYTLDIRRNINHELNRHLEFIQLQNSLDADLRNLRYQLRLNPNNQDMLERIETLENELRIAILNANSAKFEYQKLEQYIDKIDAERDLKILEIQTH